MVANAGPSGPSPEGAVPTVSVPDLRDYHLINAALVALLDEGHQRVCVAGAEGHRLLLSSLRGAWRAVVEVQGRVGPEFAAALDAPGLTVVCRGDAADGLARSLRAGLVAVIGQVGACAGYAMVGGTLIVDGRAGPRAGLNQQGGDLFLLGETDRLPGERQQGGRWFAQPERLGLHPSRGLRGGTFGSLGPIEDPLRDLNAEEHATTTSAFSRLGRILPTHVQVGPLLEALLHKAENSPPTT